MLCQSTQKDTIESTAEMYKEDKVEQYYGFKRIQGMESWQSFIRKDETVGKHNLSLDKAESVIHKITWVH